ncbi:hypothetical protein EI555_005351, partial [Monodon monoceros]
AQVSPAVRRGADPPPPPETRLISLRPLPRAHATGEAKRLAARAAAAGAGPVAARAPGEARGPQGRARRGRGAKTLAVPPRGLPERRNIPKRFELKRQIHKAFH